MNKSENNKRLVKNTLLLYVRMIVTTLVSLFTARVTLQLLGVEDYGINNVVGGIVGFVGIVTGTMTSASQRFLAYHLGNSDTLKFQNTFSMLINIFAIFCVLVALVMECVGPYLLNHVLVIPPDRLYAATWVYQFSIMSFCLTTMLIPYTSAIVSYEKMGIYAYFTFIDVFMKLLVVYALYVTPVDKLITISFLSLCSCLIVNLINYVYCKKKLIGCAFKKYWDSSVFKEVTSFAGWNLFGSTTTVLNYQGQAMLLNIFFGPIVNAAKAIADKINQIIYSFCQNFFMAMNPQIIKSYASGDLDYTKRLVFKSSRLAFMLYSFIALPLIFNMKELLYLWLGEKQVSQEMIMFSQLILVLSFMNNLESPITQTVRATGKIKNYQFVIGIQTLLFLPITYVAFRLGAAAYSSMIVLCGIYLIAMFFRVHFIKGILHLNKMDYFLNVVKPLIPVLVVSVSVLFCLHWISVDSVWMKILRLVVDFLLVAGIIIIVGLSKDERKMVGTLIANKLRRDGK